MQHVKQSSRIHNRRCLGRRLLERDRQRDRVYIEKLLRRPFWTEAPWPLLARLRRFGGVAAVVAPMDRLQPWCSAVARRERHAPAQVWPQPRPGNLAGLRIEENLLPFARRRRFIVHPLIRRLKLAHGLLPVPDPVVDSRVVGQRLLFFGTLFAWLALRREHHLHPILDGDLDRVGFPIGLVLGDLILLTAVPIHCGTDELVRWS